MSLSQSTKPPEPPPTTEVPYANPKNPHANPKEPPVLAYGPPTKPPEPQISDRMFSFVF